MNGYFSRINIFQKFRNILLKRLPLEDAKMIVMVAGPASHGHMEHEHYAGCRLLADDLNAYAPGVYAAVYRNGWPKDPTAFDNANAIVMYCDGGEKHMVVRGTFNGTTTAGNSATIQQITLGMEYPDWFAVLSYWAPEQYFNAYLPSFRLMADAFEYKGR